jgi:hypothetical protein
MSYLQVSRLTDKIATSRSGFMGSVWMEVHFSHRRTTFTAWLLVDSHSLLTPPHTPPTTTRYPPPKRSSKRRGWAWWPRVCSGDSAQVPSPYHFSNACISGFAYCVLGLALPTFYSLGAPISANKMKKQKSAGREHRQTKWRFGHPHAIPPLSSTPIFASFV